MDNPKLELAVRRHREAEAALEAARTDLEAEAVEALRAGAEQREVARVTGWPAGRVRKLAKRAGAGR